MFGDTWTVDSPGDQSAGQWETGTGVTTAPSPRQGPANAHLAVIGVGVGVMALKALIDSNLVNRVPQMIGIDVTNLAIIWFSYRLADAAAKYATDVMVAKGIALPGQQVFVKGS